MPGRILVFACCLLASLARSEPRHAITLYDEPAKYPPGFCSAARNLARICAINDAP